MRAVGGVCAGSCCIHMPPAYCVQPLWSIECSGSQRGVRARARTLRTHARTHARNRTVRKNGAAVSCAKPTVCDMACATHVLQGRGRGRGSGTGNGKGGKGACLDRSFAPRAVCCRTCAQLRDAQAFVGARLNNSYRKDGRSCCWLSTRLIKHLLIRHRY